MSFIMGNLKYKKIKELGKGGQGKVILIEMDNKYYALKEIKIEGKIIDKVAELHKEANILSKFLNENIVNYHGSFLNKMRKMRKNFVY